ncbi:hypothetical protein MKX01_022472 [Papaver californicum]|nr:hypothetical protein MKX01_022472 [Papaver californicum]
MKTDDEWITEKDDHSLQRDSIWMDVGSLQYIFVVEPRNQRTMKLAQGKENTREMEIRLVDVDKIEEVDKVDREIESHIEEMEGLERSETQIQAKVIVNGFLMMVMIWELND